MDLLKIIAIALLIGGALGLAYGGFSYTRDRSTAELGPITLSVEEKEYVNVPIWVGLSAIAIGGILLVTRRKV